MKRKIARIGPSTLMISLPTKWVKKNNLSKGDELNIEEDNNTLIIDSSLNPKSKKITLNVSKFGIMTGRVIGALYKSGYDEMKIEYNLPSTIEIIQNELSKGFIGVDIIHHTENYCIIKSMATLNHEEIDNSIRRLFRLLIDNAQESYIAVKDDNFKQLINIASKDLNINKFSDFSRRLLNKFGYKKQDKTNLIYFIAEELENIGDKYASLCRCISSNETNVSKEVLSVYKEINDFLVQYYELYYNFTEKDCSNFGDRHYTIIREIDKLYPKLNKEQSKILAKLESILVSIFDLNGPLLSCRY